MSVLLLRLAGPMQSWGTQSRFSIRETGLEPSKSGVIGLLCAALGRPRHESLTDLAALRMGVRVDREGRLAYDFHTAQNVLKAAGGLKDTEPSRRYYLADARFLVGLESSETDLLRSLYTALADPVWPLYLGRKAFVPSEPVWLPDGMADGSLLDTLQAYPRLVEPRRGEQTEKVRLVLEDAGGVEARADQPISFAQRRFAMRQVKTTFIDPPDYQDPAVTDAKDSNNEGDNDDSGVATAGNESDVSSIDYFAAV